MLTFINGAVIVPFILMLVVIGAFVSEGRWENLIILVVLSIIGYGLLKADWPRAPFVIGLVLGKIAEESLNKALGLWGMGFFLRPISLVLIGLIAITIGIAVWRQVKRSRRNAARRSQHEIAEYRHDRPDAGDLHGDGCCCRFLSVGRALHAICPWNSCNWPLPSTAFHRPATQAGDRSN